MHFLPIVQPCPSIAIQIVIGTEPPVLSEEYRTFSHPVWIIGIVTLASLSVALWIWRKKAGSRTLMRKPERIGEQSRGSKSDQGPTCLPLDKQIVPSQTGKPVPEPSESPISKPVDLHHYCDRLAAIALECSNPQTREFMTSIVARLREDAPQISEEMPISLIEELVDRIDDLRLLQNSGSEEHALRIEAFLECIATLLGTANVQLLYSESWNPEIQRALSKTPTPGISEPTIASFVSTGFSKDSKLIRKQEVLLAVPH